MHQRKESLPLFRRRSTISSNAEFDGAQTSTWARCFRLAPTTSGFCMLDTSSSKISADTYSEKLRPHDKASENSKKALPYKRVSRRWVKTIVSIHGHELIRIPWIDCSGQPRGGLSPVQQPTKSPNKFSAETFRFPGKRFPKTEKPSLSLAPMRNHIF